MYIEVIEDNVRLAKNIEKFFVDKGESISLFHSRGSFMQGSSLGADIYIIDVGLQDGNGLDIVQFLREIKKIFVPIIVISGYSGVKTKLEGFKLGIDDYIVKPFSSKELEARIEAVIHRYSGIKSDYVTMGVLQYKGVQLDKKTRAVSKQDGEVIDLSKKEKLFLEYFLEHVGILISKDQLREYVWGEDVSDNTFNVTLHKMRSKFLDDFTIETVIREGYILK